MKRKNAGVPMEPGVFFVLKRAFLLFILLAALPAAGFDLPLRAGTPVFAAPEPGAAPVAVLAEDAVAEAEEGSRTAVFWSRHPLARRCETWHVTLPGGLSGYASPALRVREGAVVFEEQAPPPAVRLLGWGALAALAALLATFLRRRQPEGLLAEWRLAGIAALVRIALLAWLVAAAQNLLCSAADEPGYFQVGYDLLRGDLAGPWTYPVGHGALFYLPLIALTGAREFNDISLLSSLVSGFLIAPLTLAAGFFILRRLGMGRCAAFAAVMLWALLPFFYHHCPDWEHQVFSAVWGAPHTGMGFFHYMTLIGCGYTGMSDPLSTLLVMLAILAALAPGGPRRRVWLTAALFGIASLVRLNNVFMAPLLAFLILRRERQPGAPWGGFRPAAGVLAGGALIYLALVSIQLAVNLRHFGSPWTFPYVLHAADLAPGDRPADGFTLHTLLRGVNLRYLVESNFAVMLAGLASLLLLRDRFLRTALALWGLPMILFFGGYSHTFCDPVRFIAVAYPALLAALTALLAENSGEKPAPYLPALLTATLLLLATPVRSGGLPLANWGIEQLMPGTRFAMLFPMLPLAALIGWLAVRRRAPLRWLAAMALMMLGFQLAEGISLYALTALLTLRAAADAVREIAGKTAAAGSPPPADSASAGR